MSKLILIVDDEESIRVSLKGILEDEGYQVLSAENGTDALDMILEEVPDLVLLDIWMPGMDGIQTLEKIKKHLAELTVVMMSGHGTIETAVKATRIGAFDFIEKPFSLDKILITIANALNYKELRKENELLRLATLKEHELVGNSPEIDSLRNKLLRIAPASAPVLIEGEEGVGKALVARAIHHYSTRRERPLVAINCFSCPGQLLETELFGYDRGAFSGAISQKRGRLDLADGGTLFLDGAEELSQWSQGELVRLLTEQCFERAGGSRPVRVDIRVILASSAPLKQLVAAGKFREDLFQLLQVVPLHIPPLRDRLEDIPLLVQHFVRLFNRREGWEAKRFDESAISRLKSYDWPGNIRELKNILERVLIMTSAPVVTADDLPELLPVAVPECSHAADLSSSGSNYSGEESLQEARVQFEKRFIREVLIKTGQDLEKAAQQLQLDRTVLHRKLIQYGMLP